MSLSVGGAGPADRNEKVVENAVRLVDELSETIERLSSDLVAQYQHEQRLLQGIRARDAKVAKLTAEVNALRTERVVHQARIERLLSVRLMKLQRAYWRLLGKLRAFQGRGKEQ